MVQKKAYLLFFKKEIPFKLVLALLLFLAGIFSVNTEAASDKIPLDVKSRMLGGESVPVIIILKDQPSVKAFAKENAISSLKSHASGSQQELGALLKEEKSRGKADKIKQFWIVNAVAVKASPELIEEISKREDVARIELDSELRIIGDFSTQVSQGQINNATSEINRINATRIWELGIDGTGINVSVIDTGINASHPDIAGRVIKGYDFVNNDNDPADDNGHGTHVAGTVGGNGSGGTTTGVAPNVSLFGVKVLGAGGSGSESNVISGIEWSVNNGANIISMSLGTSITWTTSNCDADNPAMASAINNAVASGVVVVAAAGNNASGVSSPGCIRNVTAVGSVDSTDVIAPTSGRGAAMTDHGVVAPGVSITSLNYLSNGYTVLSGTSMATPHVSGAVALLLHAANRQGTPLTPSQIKSILNSTSIDLGTSGNDTTYGRGRINVSAAILSIDTVGPSVVANPTGYLGENTAARNGTAITLNATITDSISGVKNASVNVSAINASFTNISLSNSSGFWTNSSVIVNASDGIYYLNVTAYDNVSNVNNSVRLSVTIDGTKPRILNASASLSEIEAGSGTATLRANASDNTSGVAGVTVNLSEINGSSSASMSLSSGNSTNGTWQLTINSTVVGNFSLAINATDGAGNVENMNVLLNVTDRTAPLVTSAVASPDSIRANGTDNTTLRVNAHDFSNVSSIRNVTVNLSQLGGNAIQELGNSSSVWQLLNVNTVFTNKSGTLIRLPVNVTDARNNSNTSISILLGIKAQVNATAGNRTSFNFTVDSSTFGANITIPASTSLSGELLIAPVELPALGGLTSAGVALNFSNLTFNTSLKIEIEYNSTFFNDSANISKLRLWSYNTTTAAWNITENSSVDTQNSTVSGNASHFSVFAPLADVTAPVISSVASGSITSSSAIITWTTDEASQSIVKYGTTSGSYTLSKNDTSNVTSHSIQLTGLSSSATYYFVANSTDQSGNRNQSAEQSFTTSSTGSTASSSGGGGGGGGGGGVSGENASNIEVKEKYDLHIFKDKVTSYKFTNKSNPVLFVNITGNISAGEVNVAIEALKNTSTLVKTPPPGAVYKNINIWVGSSGFATPKNIKNAEIGFMVEKEWASGNEVSLYRYDSEWVKLPTQKIKEDEEFEYYVSSTNKFSPFAITGLKAEASATFEIAVAETAVVPAQTTPVPTTVAEKGAGLKPTLTITTVILAVITTLLALVYIMMRKRNV